MSMVNRRDTFAADVEALDLRAAPGLALPARGDAPAGLALGGVALDSSISANRSSTLMPLTTFGVAAILVWEFMVGLLAWW